MTDPGTSTAPPPKPTGRTVPTKWVGAAIGAVVVLALTFYAGVAYENNRITSGIEDAFSGLGEVDSRADGQEQFNEETVAPVELTEDTPVEVTTFDGVITVTLLSTELTSGAAADDVLTRNFKYQVKVENTGETPVTPSLSPHFESDEGQVFEFAGVFCDDEESLPTDSLDPGPFVEGCESSDLSDDAGRLVFADSTPDLYITVPAA